MKIAVIGSRGYIGRHFASEITRRGQALVEINREDFIGCDADSLSAVLRGAKPDAVINAAGYTGKPNVDACESDKTTCLAGNAVLPGIVSIACASLAIPWAHVSSGCIYSGRPAPNRGFTEADLPNFTFRQNNCSFYSGTKALGEEVLMTAERCYILRLRMPYSQVDSARNYLSKLMRYERLLEAENSLSNLDEYVAAALDCLERQLPFGTYNVTNPGSLTTTQIVDLIRRAGVCDREFDFFDSESEFMQTVAKAPRSCCVLDSSKAISAGLKLTPVYESVQACLDGWLAESKSLR